MASADEPQHLEGGLTATCEPVLEARDLGRFFSDRATQSERWIIKGLSFALHEGEFVTLVGPSGSGKSTLLNLLAQIDRPSAGEIRLHGEVIGAPSPPGQSAGANGRIGYIMQDDNLLPWRTLRANVEYPLQIQGRLDASFRKRVDELIAAVGLNGFENHYPHELSGGMRKRASIIRTLAYDPPVILMDEPFGALDAESRLHIQKDLVRLWELGRKTILFVTLRHHRGHRARRSDADADEIAGLYSRRTPDRHFPPALGR